MDDSVSKYLFLYFDHIFILAAPLNKKIDDLVNPGLEPEMGMSARTKTPIRRGKTQLPPLSDKKGGLSTKGGSSKTPTKKAPNVQKPTGVDLPGIQELLTEERVPSHRYISRNTVRFDDAKSDCADDVVEEVDDENANKTGAAYLEK
jgi:hypothetical protein